MALEQREFNLNGNRVVATELTLGQFKKVQKVSAEHGDIEGTSLMVALATGVTVEQLDELPASAISDFTEIVSWLSDFLSKS